MVCCSAVLVGLNSRTRTEDPEHEADLYVSEQNIGRTKRVFQRVVDVLVQSAHVAVVVDIVRQVEQSRNGRDHVTAGRDHVRAIVQSERGGSEQDEEAEVRQRMCDELGRRTA